MGLSAVSVHFQDNSEHTNNDEGDSPGHNARVGHPHCPNCGREIKRQSPQEIVERMFSIISEEADFKTDKGVRFIIFSPVVKDRKGEFSSLFENLKKQKKIWNKNFENYGEYNSSGDAFSERTAGLNTAVERITEDIIIDITSNW